MTSTADPRPAALPEIDGAPWGLALSHRYADDLVGLNLRSVDEELAPAEIAADWLAAENLN